MGDYQLSQKFKLLGNYKFNHLINILTLSLTLGFRPFFNDCFNTIKNYQLSQKLKLLRKSNTRDTTNFTTKCLQIDMAS